MNPDREGASSSTRSQAADLVLSSVFRLRDLDHLEEVMAGRAQGHIYARDGHPNADSLAERLARMEGGEAAVLAPSGMGAITALALHLLRPRDRLVADERLYGKTATLFEQILKPLGIDVAIRDLHDEAEATEAIVRGTRLVWVESLSNPLLRFCPIERLSTLAHQRGATLVVDSTFTPPPILRPLEMGADVVMHSVTKIISGHSDVTMGALIGGRSLMNAVRTTASTLGFHVSAFDCWLVERSLLTLDARIRAACANARRLAEWLADRSEVRRVIYPSLPEHPDVGWTEKCAPLAGHVVGFELDGRERVNRFLGRLRHVAFCPSLGDAMTTASHPWSTSHRSRPVVERIEQGITEGLVRMSVGIEPFEQIAADLSQALAEPS